MKEKILRVRPFNMANFSSGAGAWVAFLVLFIPIFSWIAMFPATFFVWAGFALPIEKEEDGQMDYFILERRLNRILFPICVAVYVLLIVLAVWGALGLDIEASEAVDIIIGTFIFALLMIPPTFGIYFSAKKAAFMLYEENKLTKGKYLRYLLIAALFKILATIGVMVVLYALFYLIINFSG